MSEIERSTEAEKQADMPSTGPSQELTITMVGLSECRRQAAQKAEEERKQLVQKAKHKRFRLEDGLLKLKQPLNAVLATVVVVTSFFPIFLSIVIMDPIFLIGLLVPLAAVIAYLTGWREAVMVFDDSQRVVYHRSGGLVCKTKETIIGYSDCVGFEKVTKKLPCCDSRYTLPGGNYHYKYLLSTHGGNYEVFDETRDEKDLLNAFLQERLAASKHSANMPDDA
eukprot:TRINITY_DN34421_c0_g1_i1.p1 TRINITY_DN34421_c0_g1~~TRINITY_DN34421_c0_g1_i1.p1  ORF type:complete len:224 (+),score=28.12 TRINITY_DN34421_c0_g1_i1:398-1069(+)